MSPASVTRDVEGHAFFGRRIVVQRDLADLEAAIGVGDVVERDIAEIGLFRLVGGADGDAFKHDLRAVFGEVGPCDVGALRRHHRLQAVSEGGGVERMRGGDRQDEQ